MKKYVISFFFIVIVLVGCNGNKDEAVYNVPIEEIETIYLQHGSDNVHVKSTDQSDLEATYANKEIDIEHKDNEVTLSVRKKLFHIGPKINLNKKLEVSIPKNYVGQVVISGTSGNITSENLEINELKINENSGDVALEFTEFHSDVAVKTKSGNIKLALNNNEPDIDLKTKTASGKQTITIPIETTKQNDKVIEGKSGNGTYLIELTTASGNISIQ
ncbi:DUF4097 family beta strand repeat-containing protein [Pseudogracilibacillus auburnensis]|uniref:Putative adhesin n=1 Tax=Pseudogracilibacillus auburnensis TaxID=1494959 RepID=A0A2V3WGG0_9BACI|nr:DUF4097 family beta strand repeat-containing protein [Pseudogracilibacillus auburnensis]PXW87919.1 putative adhesin [Pseudogracilibacillus auburnensis]